MTTVPAPRAPSRHLLLQALSVSLIGQHLLFLECFLRESDLNFNYRCLIDDPCPRLTLIHKELVPCDLNCLTFLQIAHEASKEVWLQDLWLDQLDRLVGLTTGCCKHLLRWPDRSNSDDPDTLGHTGVHLDFSAIWDRAKVRSAILHEKLLILDLKDLSLE